MIPTHLELQPQHHLEVLPETTPLVAHTQHYSLLLVVTGLITTLAVSAPLLVLLLRVFCLLLGVLWLLGPTTPTLLSSATPLCHALMLGGGPADIDCAIVALGIPSPLSLGKGGEGRALGSHCAGGALKISPIRLIQLGQLPPAAGRTLCCTPRSVLVDLGV